MRTKMTTIFPETALERILDALERELMEASDADILEAANDLGMRPQMKGSAAFLGLCYTSVPDPEWMLRMLNDPQRIWLASAGLPMGRKPVAGEPAPGAATRTRPGGKRSRATKEPRES